MAKYTRTTVGSIIKGKEGKADYFLVNKSLKEPVVLQAGDILNLESKTAQLASLEAAVSSGKLQPEYGDKARERINKIPDFVRFDVIMAKKN